MAFIAATIVLSVSLRLFATGSGASAEAEARMHAALLAQSTLEAVGRSIPMTVGETVDSVDGRFVRRVAIRRAPEVEPEARSPRQSRDRTQAFQVDVSVTWRERVRERSVDLSVIRLASSP